MNRRLRILVLLVIAVASGSLLLLPPSFAAYTPSSESPSSELIVEMTDNEFHPAVLRVAPGATIVWKNAGRIVHTVTADDRSWDSGDLTSGQPFSRTFEKPGVYRYFCKPHGTSGGHGMAGVVLVGEAQADLLRPPAYPERPPSTLRVPQDYPTIQRAVDAARPGDLILISPGVYREEIVVTTPSLTLRGLDRNRVILDGQFRMTNGVKVLGAGGVVIENMMARHFTANGFYWTGVRGYRASYLTAYNNGDYGIYAFDSVFGQFDHSYASGHPDSGFYIGQCKPCHAVITEVLAEGNALGYSGTNAGGNLTIMNSVWRHNLSGIVPNTLDTERLAPQDNVRIVGNLIYANHNASAPFKRLQYPTFGSGIILAGGINNVVEGNQIWDHPNFGILVVANIDKHLWIASGHLIRSNTVWASGRADLALAAPAGPGNCLAQNRFVRSRPPAIESLYGCGSLLARVGGGDPGALIFMLRQYLRATSGRYTSPDWRTMPVPPLQPGMPDPLSPPRPAWPTEESRKLPAQPASAPSPVPVEAGSFAGTVPAGRPPELTGLILYLLPWLLYEVTVGLIGWDLSRRRLSRLRKIAWFAAASFLPYLGALAYVVSRQRTRRPMRWA